MRVIKGCLRVEFVFVREVLEGFVWEVKVEFVREV